MKLSSFPIGAVTLTALPLLSVFTVMLFIGLLADKLGLEFYELGLVGSAEIMGMVIAGLFAMLFPFRMKDRAFLFSMGMVSLLAQILSAALFHSQPDHLFEYLLAIRFLVGLGEGILASCGYQLLSRYDNATRYYGWGMTLQSLCLVLAFLAIPFINTHFDTWLGYTVTNSLVMLVCIIAVVKINIVDKQDQKTASYLNASIFRPASILVLVGGLAAFVDHGAIDSFVERIGNSHLLDQTEIGLSLSIASAVGIVAGLVSAFQSNRFGMALPLLFVFVGELISTPILYYLADSFIWYSFALSLYNFMWTYSIAFQLNIAAKLGGERLTGFMTSVQGSGMAIGSAAGGFVLTGASSYLPLYAFCISMAFISLTMFSISIRAYK